MTNIAILRASGLTDSQILRVVETELAANREAARIRQRNHRARHSDKRDICDQKEIPPTPPKEKLPCLLPLVASFSESRSRERVSVAGRELQKQVDADFELFYQRYPLHKGRRAAKKAYVAARKRAEHSVIMAGLERYIATQNPDFYCHPATWLNQDRWLDEPLKPAEQPINSGWREGMPTTEELRAKYEKGAKMGKDKPVVSDGLRPRNDQQGMVGTETRKPGMGSLGCILRSNGMDAASLARKLGDERSQVNHGALPVAGMAADDDGNYPFEGAI